MTDPRKLGGRALAEELQKYCSGEFAKAQAADLKRWDDAAMAKFLAEREARVKAGTATPREMAAHTAAKRDRIRAFFEKQGMDPNDPKNAELVENCVNHGADF